MAASFVSPPTSPLVGFLGSALLLSSFAMLSMRRMASLVRIFALQGILLTLSTLSVALAAGEPHLFFSALFTLAFKVLLLPILLFRLLERLHIRGEVEVLLNVPTTMVVGLFVVVFSFALAAPISEMANTVSRGLIGVGLAALLLSFLMMITRRKAVTQVLGFLGMENALFFSAINATYGMPMVVELGVAFDVLVGTFVFGIFFFQIRETFESFDLKHMDNTPTE
ncbi:MAG: formate hydrogenlyase [Nitrospirae bacterium]|jgi:hydrogenase-4 component E|uniref:Probable hydrogenase-4 membrane component (HyfE) n=1 Tax=Leptospirillum ferrodiazotrophum TaxID=412449 RepID=C6HVM7_9BACT|nr:MAG: probable hydrogenase-4 membrane component (HyfE) [Leptospirillum ferrodiazotrophum]MCL5953279.1 formate hydrogenlyase [Nitrospirota bacterium]